MPCTCHNDKKNCKPCTECRDTHCRCLDCRAPLAVPLESPEHLVRAHDAHLEALAHLELALAALGGLPTDKSFTDKAREFLSKAHKQISDKVSQLANSKLAQAAYEHSKPAMDAVKRKLLKPMIEKSNKLKTIVAAGSAGSNESSRANAEAAAHANDAVAEVASTPSATVATGTNPYTNPYVTHR